MRDFFVFTMIMKTRPWRIPRPKNHDIEILRLKNRDIEIRGLKHHGIEKRRQISHDIVIPRRFFSEDIEISRLPRHRDSKDKKPRHWVPVEFWSLCPLINNSDCVIFGNGAFGEIKDHSLSRIDFLKNF